MNRICFILLLTTLIVGCNTNSDSMQQVYTLPEALQADNSEDVQVLRVDISEWERDRPKMVALSEVRVLYIETTESKVIPPAHTVDSLYGPEWEEANAKIHWPNLLYMPKVEEIYFTTVDSRALPEELAKLPELKAISVMYCGLRDLDRELKLLRSIENLQTLDIDLSILSQAHQNRFEKAFAEIDYTPPGGVSPHY